MALELVQDRDNKNRIKVFQPGRNGTGKKNIAGFIHIVFQHAILVVQFIQLFTDKGFLFFGNQIGGNLHLNQSIDAVVQQDHKSQVGAGYREIAAECMRMYIVLEILDAKSFDFVFRQVFLQGFRFFNAYLRLCSCGFGHYFDFIFFHVFSS